MAVAAVAVRAQTGGAMPADHKMEQMAPDMTYVGCVERGSMAKAFVLTHVTAGGDMKPAKKQDRDKKKDDMSGGSMDMMAPSSVALHVAPPEVSGHVGHKVSVVGSLDKASDGDVERGRRDESHADTEREVGEDGCGDVSVTQRNPRLNR